MATFEVTIKFRYLVSDDPEYRDLVYGTPDLQECAEIDAQNDVGDLLMCAGKDLTVSIRPVDLRE